MPQHSTASIDSSCEIYAGADLVRTYRWLEEGSPVDLTGWSGACKFERDGVGTLFTATVTLTDPTAGEFQVTIDAATTGAETPVIASTSNTICSPASFEPFDDQYEPLAFDVNLTDTSGVVWQKVRGIAKFYGSAT